jgi:hypothetical protein
MNDDEWGYFIDVELDPTSNKTNTPIKTQHPSPTKLNVIYEEEIWHRKDDYDYEYDYYYYYTYKDTNNDAEVVSKHNQNPSENDESTSSSSSTSESASIIIYFVICASFISWTIILL